MSHSAAIASDAAELPSRIETAVIGGGQAGLAMSWTLTQAGREHVVLEAREQLGGSWLKRWDSFCLVTPNFSLRLPGFVYEGPDQESFMSRQGLVDYVAGYARSFGSPVALGTRATGVDAADGEMRIETNRGAIRARNVVVATGAFQRPNLPAVGDGLPPGMAQLHTDAYRNERELEPGAVLVVGSGQSGAQIAEELHEAGRRVFLSVSSCGRAPRRYRGRDTFWWLSQMGARAAEAGKAPMTVDDLPTPRARFACNPHLSGKDGGHEINLRRLGADGVTLLGHVAGVADGRITLADDLEANLRSADAFFHEKIKPDIDEFISAAAIDAPSEDVVQFDYDPPLIRQLSVADENIATVIWATGYRLDLGWVRPASFDEMGYPIHVRGVTEVPGLYFLGLPWLYTQTSSLFVGVGNDAAHLGTVIDRATAT